MGNNTELKQIFPLGRGNTKKIARMIAADLIRSLSEDEMAQWGLSARDTAQIADELANMAERMSEGKGYSNVLAVCHAIATGDL